MKLNRFVILSLVDICMAQRWKLDRGCDHWGAANKEKLKVAFREAVTMAGTALDVLNKNPGDQKVQKMVKHIFGDDEKLVKEAKEILGGVKKYDDQPNPYFDAPFWRNTDLIVYCDPSNYEEHPDKSTHKLFNLDLPKGSPHKKQHDVCFAANPQRDGNLVMAITLRSEGVDRKKYNAAIDEWKKKGSKGTAPDERAYIVSREDIPNTMDLCTWYLRDVFNTNAGFVTVDDASIAKVQQKSFLDTIPKAERAVDQLVQSLAGTFLHELTHTYLGGRTFDYSYGWVNSGKHHPRNNADSMAQLGVAMHLFKKGYWVDDDGNVKKIQK
ncbi:hypothetical protein N656DRAFT_778772 [Canariomyces notabilis]|uniref:Lysine-specific metallo-endopeptidase domain-containing protein n=1 Tax=Canariomyces notabilis TaxID=2074819 RepID=A0AAN6TF05_9PEZI|nr:hypothetical protein N656DRAFT_778772 [Canariomyces arenarius]